MFYFEAKFNAGFFLELSVEDRLDSLKSDGIPVGNELSGDGDQYIWSSDHDEADNPDKLPDLTSQYPPEELPERFSEVSSLVGFIFDQFETNWI